MAKGIIICIGKLKNPLWKAAAEYYLKQIRAWRKLDILELRDSAAPACERPIKEAAAILAALQAHDLPILLTEKGSAFDSPKFADFLRACDEADKGRPAFIIGGPYGHAENLLRRCPIHLSLSAMTWPHELARVMLLEQLYRAESILRDSPYHHGDLA